MKVSAVLSLLFVVAAKDLSQGTHSIAEMGSAQLLEMKEELSSKIASGEEASDDEKKTLRYFKQMIINTSLVNINISVAAARKGIADGWSKVTECDSTLERNREDPDEKRTDTWTEYKAQVTANHDALKACYPTKPTSCDSCADFIKNMEPSPTTAQPELGNKFLFNFWNDEKTDEQNADINAEIGKKTSLHTTFAKWYELYDNWHCGTISCEFFEPPQDTTRYHCVKACSDECDTDLENWNNEVKACKKLQTAFEKSVCTLHNAIGSSCVSYSSCRVKHDADYEKILADEKKQDALRKLEYRIMRTIICYIDLMVKYKSIKESQKKDCEKDWDTNWLNLAEPHVKVPEWNRTSGKDGRADCSCEKLPSSQWCVSAEYWPTPGKTGRTQHSAWDGVYPTPCGKDFQYDWYQKSPTNPDLELCRANTCDKDWETDIRPPQ